MSINALGSFAELGLGKLLGNKPPFLEILAQPNEVLSPNGLLQRAVGKALGTENAARINDFLGQSGLSLHTLPQPFKGASGANIYRVPTGERFWQSIGTFQQTGNALPLARSLTNVALAQTPNFTATNPTQAFASKQGVTSNIERARLAPQPSLTKRTDRELYTDKLTDAKGIAYSGRPDDLRGDEVFGVKVTVTATDTKESLLKEGYRTAANAAGYKEPEATQIATAYTAYLKDAKNITGIVDVDTQTASRTGAANLENLRAAKSMDFYVTGAEIKEFDRLSYQGKLADAIAEGKPLTQEMLERSGVDREKLNSLLKEMNWQPIPTFNEAVDKLAAEKKAEVIAQKDAALRPGGDPVNFATYSPYYGMSDAELTAYTHKQAEGEITRQIGTGQLQVRPEERPDSISATNTPKWQTDAKLLIEKYMPGIAALNTPEGIKTTAVEAFTASFINARLFGATKLYVDQSRFHNEQERGNAQIMSVAGSTIGELQNLTMAGKTVEAAMATTKVAQGVKILNESGQIGKLIVQTLPSAATFGGLQTAKETVKAATGNSEGAQQAVTNIARETSVGAVFGVFEPLKVGMRVPAVVASSYGVEKVFGASDKEAALSALTNGLFSIAGGRGRAAEELAGKTIRVTGENGTAANVKVSVDAGKRIVLTEVAANVKADLQVKVSALKEAVQARVQNAGQYLRDKVTVTEAEVAQARKVITDYHSQQAKAPNLNASLYMPPIPDNPKVMGAYLTLAKNTIAEGATNFKEFSTRLTAKYGREVQPHLDKLYEKAAADTVVKANQADVQAFRAEQAKIKEGFAAITDFRKSNGLPQYDLHRDAQGEVTGTVAFSRANGQIEFGTNTTIGAKYLGTNNSELRRQAIADIQAKLGKLEGARYNDKDTKFLTHAEAESFLKLAKRNGGKLPEEVEIYSDRPTCSDCRGTPQDVGVGLSLLTELYGVKKLTVIDSYGTKYIIRPNQTTEIIK